MSLKRTIGGENDTRPIIRVRFSSETDGTLEKVEKYFVERNTPSSRKVNYAGTFYALEVDCHFFSLWHYQDLIGIIGHNDLYFSVHGRVL